MVTVEQVPMVAGVTDLNLTVPGRGLNLAAAGFAFCFEANWAAVKLVLRATPIGFAVAAGFAAGPVVTPLPTVDSGVFDAKTALGAETEATLL